MNEKKKLNKIIEIFFNFSQCTDPLEWESGVGWPGQWGGGEPFDTRLLIGATPAHLQL